MISDTSGAPLSNYEDYFSVNAGLLNRTNAVPQYFNPNEYGSKRCEEEDLANLKNIVGEEEVFKLIKLPLICLKFDQNAIIQNDYAFLNSSYVNVAFKYCNPSIKKCAPDSKKKENDFYVRTYFVNNYVNSFDYDNPIKFYLDSHLQQVNKGTLRRNFLRFTISKFISDKGWLFEENIESTYINFKSINVEANANPPNFQDDYYWITISSPQIRLITYRAYLKVQELAAKVGGIVNALNIAAYLIFSNYLRYIYIFNVGKHILEGEILFNLKSSFNNIELRREDSISKMKLHKEDDLREGEEREKNDEREERDEIRLKIKKEEDSNRLSQLNINKNNIRENCCSKNNNNNNNTKNKSNDANNYNLNNSEIGKLDRTNNKKNNDIVNLSKLEKIFVREPVNNKNLELSKTIDYISNTSYMAFLWEMLKENILCCCFGNNEYYLNLKNFIKVHLDFFLNIKKLTTLPTLTD